MRRRTFLCGLTLGTLAGPFTAEAQQTAKVWRVAIVITGSSGTTMVRQGLRDRGYVEGQNLVTDHRSAEGRPERYGRLFSELLAHNPDVMVVAGAPAMTAAQKATTTVPIVALDRESDPVAAGFAKSLARPGGNITGIFVDLPELAGKQLQLLRETLPVLTRVAVLGDSSINQAQFRAVEAVARSAGITVKLLPVQRTEDIESAIGQASRDRANALVVLTGPVMFANWERIADLAVKHRLPSTSMALDFHKAGGLMAYGPSEPEMFQRRLPAFVDRILKGASPGDLPIERPTTFELMLNAKTAKALQLTIPPALLLRADQVIE